MRLKLIVHLVRKETMDREFERLPYEPLEEEILDVPVRKTVIAVDAGRNLAVLGRGRRAQHDPAAARHRHRTRNSSSATTRRCRSPTRADARRCRADAG
jgi:serine kinase of HPr protein (carbohydrate metabolism regulator)